MSATPSMESTGCGDPAKSCFCITLDAARLRSEMGQALGPVLADETLEGRWPHAMAPLPVFVPEATLQRMAQVVAAVERVIALPAWRALCLEQAPAIARHSPAGALGVFLGYDFHADGEQLGLIEINTNAGGALINTMLARAQRACCPALGAMQPSATDADRFEERIVAMFQREWALSGASSPLRRVAIVDAEPTAQFLYPEFLLFQALFERHGIQAVVAGPQELAFDGSALLYRGEPVDLVYNRLTDFYLEEAGSAALRAAYLADRVVLTPHPQAHALYADKTRLVVLSDPQALERLGVDAADRELLAQALPRTERVSAEQADDLWARRRHLFFKPTSGYGGRAAYRGDKLTRRAWEDVLAGDFVAQALVPPGMRPTGADVSAKPLKFDLRNYVYDGQVQWVAARLYQGQTTNMRTEGGGFAPVYSLAPQRQPQAGADHGHPHDYASYVFLLSEQEVHPIPHALYVALARAQGASAHLAGRSFRLVDWQVRQRQGRPEAVVREWYGWVRFDEEGRFDPSPAGASGAGARSADNVDHSAEPSAQEVATMRALVFGETGCPPAAGAAR